MRPIKIEKDWSQERMLMTYDEAIAWLIERWMFDEALELARWKIYQDIEKLFDEYRINKLTISMWNKLGVLFTEKHTLKKDAFFNTPEYKSFKIKI